MSIVGDHESINSSVLDSIGDSRIMVALWNRWELLHIQMLLVVLLGHQLSHAGSHFFTDGNGLGVSFLWVEGAISDSVNKLGSFGTLQNTWVFNGEFLHS